MSLKDDLKTARAVVGPIDTAFRFYKGASMIYDCYEPQIDETHDTLDDARTNYRKFRRLYRLIRD